MTDKEKEHIISIITVRRLLPCKVKSTKNILSVSHIWALQQSYCEIIPVLLYRKQERPVGCLGNVELKIISYENKNSIISFIIDFNFSDHGKITSKNPTDCRTRCARRICPRICTFERWYSFRGSMEPEQSAFAPRPFHRNRSGPDVAGTDRFLVQVPSRIGEEERSDPNRDSRNTHPCRILRGLAESVGGFPYGKRGLDRR